MGEDEAIKRRFELLAPHLDERTRRLMAASEAVAIGRGGASAVARATGVSRRVIWRGISELETPGSLPEGRVRRPGGGRKSAVESHPGLRDALEALVESTIRGDPESALRWTCKSVRNLGPAMAKISLVKQTVGDGGGESRRCRRARPSRRSRRCW